jgi:glucose-6-phosphate 1-dehydrogenase
MSQIIPVQPFDYVVFGGTGDLSMRKLFPALYYREVDGQLPDDASVIAVARGELSQEQFLSDLEAALRKNVDAEYFDTEVLQRFAARFRYLRLDALTPEGYADLVL